MCFPSVEHRAAHRPYTYTLCAAFRKAQLLRAATSPPPPFFCVCVLVVSWSSFRGFPAFPTCRGGKIALFVFLKRKQFDHSDTHWTGADNFRSLCFFEGLRYREHFTEAYCERFTFLACASVWRNPSVPKYEVEWLVLYVVKRGSERPLLSKAGRLDTSANVAALHVWTHFLQCNLKFAIFFKIAPRRLISYFKIDKGYVFK